MSSSLWMENDGVPASFTQTIPRATGVPVPTRTVGHVLKAFSTWAVATWTAWRSARKFLPSSQARHFSPTGVRKGTVGIKRRALEVESAADTNQPFATDTRETVPAQSV